MNNHPYQQSLWYKEMHMFYVDIILTPDIFSEVLNGVISNILTGMILCFMIIPPAVKAVCN